MHIVDLGDSFPTHIDLENLASIQPRTSPVKFAGGAGASKPGPPGAGPPPHPAGLVRSFARPNRSDLEYDFGAEDEYSNIFYLRLMTRLMHSALLIGALYRIR